jgi:aspartate/methionine/tyrosine aminotransferase
MLADAHGHDPLVLTRLASDRLQQCRNAIGGARADGRIGMTMNDPGVISFSHGNGISRPPRAVIDAGRAALDDGAHNPIERYNFKEPDHALHEAIRDTMRHDGVPDDHLARVCVDRGTTSLFNNAIPLLMERGEILLTSPGYYHSLAGWCDRLGVALATTPGFASEEYKLTAEAIEATQFDLSRRFHRAARVLVVFNPTPTGALYTEQEIDDIAAVAQRWNLSIIEDAVFSRTRFDQTVPLTRFAAHPELVDRVVTFDGTAKADGLANDRIGWAVGPPAIVDALDAAMASVTVHIPYVAAAMTRAALTVGRDAARDSAYECAIRAGLVEQQLRELQANVDGPAHFELAHRPQAGHSSLVRLVDSESGQPLRASSPDITATLLDEYHVAMSPALSSGIDGPTFRINYAGVTDNSAGFAELQGSNEHHAHAQRLIRQGIRDRLGAYVMARRDLRDDGREYSFLLARGGPGTALGRDRTLSRIASSPP